MTTPAARVRLRAPFSAPAQRSSLRNATCAARAASAAHGDSSTSSAASPACAVDISSGLKAERAAPAPASAAKRARASAQQPARNTDSSAANQRRRMLAATLLMPMSSAALASWPDVPPAHASAADTIESTASKAPKITENVFLDVGLCPEAYRSDRTIGDKSALCTDAAPLGRITIGLFGDAAPGTVARFKKLLADGTYNGTIFHKVLPNRFIKAGQQGSFRMGQVALGTTRLPPNDDVVSTRALATPHSKAGIVSWCLAENDDEEVLKQRQSYANTEFLITTGSGPQPDLDGSNVAFGQVLEGWEVISEITSVPVIKSNDTMQTYNRLASFLGDDRAARAKSKWGKPLKAVVITNSGMA